MKFEKYHPSKWLQRLQSAVASSQCRSQGKTIDFDCGCDMAGTIISETIEKDAGIWWVGNGGSAAICSHLSQDMLNKLGARSFYPGDASLMTCMSNDYGYRNVYVQPLEKLTRPDDLLIAISSSGNSENILSCAKMAHTKGMKMLTLSGFRDDNRLWNLPASLSFFVQASLFGIVELSHEAIMHGIIESLWLENNEEMQIVSDVTNEKIDL